MLLELAKLTLCSTDFPLGPLLDEVGAAFRPRLAEKGLAFHDERRPGLPAEVHTDRDRLRQVLFNLLSNAVKFTRQGSVRLEVAPGGGADAAATVRFLVADTGIGIAADERTRIFEAFHQVSERALAAQGTGLGLAISQKLVELLGGTLQVESTPKAGSRFWFDLPLLAVAAPTVASGEGHSPSGHGTAITGYQGIVRRLLVVDDHAENRRILRDLLAPLGFSIEEAADGAACLEQCKHQRPDAVLLDLRLGQPDGFEVARTLRQRERAEPPLVIVALSASVFEHDRQQALEAGCDDFLPKPFRTDQILSVLGRLLQVEWIYAEPATFHQETGANGSEQTPPAAELDVLLELCDQGDLLGIRKRFEAWETDTADSGRAAFARQFLPLVASYRIDELHAQLSKLRETAT